MQNSAYVLITPAHNEGLFIENTITLALVIVNEDV